MRLSTQLLGIGLLLAVGSCYLAEREALAEAGSPPPPTPQPPKPPRRPAAPVPGDDFLVGMQIDDGERYRLHLERFHQKARELAARLAPASHFDPLDLLLAAGIAIPAGGDDQVAALLRRLRDHCDRRATELDELGKWAKERPQPPAEPQPQA